MATDAVDPTAVEYARRLFANVVFWYENADRKAQLILTANGGFLTILAALSLSKPQQVEQTLDVFGPETWLFAGGTAAAIATSFVSAALVLWSRLMSHSEAHETFADHGVRVDNGETYDASVLWFFQLVQHLEEDQFERRLAVVSQRDEIEALADQIVKLSKRVTTKHFWVNVGFVATATGLTCLLATAASYAVRLAE